MLQTRHMECEGNSKNEIAKKTHMNEPIQTAVVTGGHAFDVVGFHRLFRGLEGVEAYIQHMDDFANSSPTERDFYDVVLFYTMLLEEPMDDGPHFRGNPKSALEQLDQSQQGIFILHHSILAFPEWLVWNQWVGIHDLSSDLKELKVTKPETIPLIVSDAQHPVTKGMENWEMLDELYLMNDPHSNSSPLLTTNHPDSMRTLAWTRHYKDHRILCWQSGHDNQTWINANFKSFLRRGIQWCASRI